MADLVHLSQSTGPEPQLSAHLATKNYVDTTHNYVSLNTITGDATLSLSVEMLRVNASSAATITVPANATVAFPVGARRWVRRVGTANVSVVGAGGVTINWPLGAATITTQYVLAELVKVGTDTWDGVLLGA